MNAAAHKPLADPDGGAISGPPPPNVVDETAHLVIDPFAGVLEAVNLPGRRLLRLAPATRLPLPLDTAMPGLRRLRAISLGAPQGTREELLLWSCGKPVRVSAEVLKETMSDGRSRMVVRALNGQASADLTPDQGRSAHAPALAAKPAAPVTVADVLPEQPGDAAPVVRDDRETLREIARRIREGHAPAAPEAANDQAPRGEPEAAEPQPVTSKDAREAAPSDAPAPSPQPQSQRAPELMREGQPLPPRPSAAPAPDARTLSKVAHELRTPLSAIVAAAEIMRDEQLGPMGNQRYLGYAGDIHESARHALDVINAMLSSTPRDPRPAVVMLDLNAIVETTVSALTPLATSNGVGLEADTVSGALEVRGDATGIRQIIYNLVSNAMKFTPADGYVHVATGLLPDGTPYFVVRDTGEGMSEDEIVQAFYAEATSPRRGGGYGIGLPMVRRLAEAMGATIDVDSTPGKGTVVLVSFPFGV